MTMQPGTELDALVAEKVMGLVPGVDFGEWPEHQWKKKPDGTIDDMASEWDTHNGPCCERCWYSYCHHCQDGPDVKCKKTPPGYSTSIGTAWAVVDKLRMTIGPRHWQQDRIGLWIADCGEPGRRIYGAAETAPHAICLAALSAVGWKWAES